MGAGGSVHAVRLRLTRLDTDGTPLVGADNMYTSSALVTLAFTEQYTDDEEIEQKNGAGDVCIYYKKVGALKSLETKLTICTMDPELAEILRGGTVLEASGSAIGYAAPAVGVDAQPNGISLEMWSRRVIGGSQANDRPWYRWLLPRGRFKRDEATFGNEAAQPSFTGVFEENDGWGQGPLEDWPTGLESGRIYQYIETATAPPVAVQGYQAVPDPEA
jgi:hypothetical protein